MLLTVSFVCFTIFMGILQYIFRVNILKIIVLAGTCALAIAFAGSDLANFIGVTIAGVDSYTIASAHAAAGGDVSTLMMGELANPVAVPPLYLMLSGGVMILTLWFSKKARTVTETGVKLSRQDEGIERFGSTPASRALVHSATSLNRRVSAILPDRVNRFIDKRLKPSQEDEKDKASFDLIRATVNITVAALLISTATSMKLTLSTTYVTFMVAMGTSLADRAWGRESAVYRISGVLTIISGWFLTALVAFSAGAIIAFLLMWGGNIALAGLLALCVFMLIQSSRMHKRREQKRHHEEKLVVERSSIIEQCNENVCQFFGQMGRLYSETLNGLAAEDRKELRRLCKEARDLYEQGKERKYHEMLPTLDKLQEDAVNTGHYYVQVVDYLSEVSKSLMSITKSSSEYIDNNHTGLSAEQVSDLEAINKAVSEVYSGIVNMIRTANFDDFDRILDMRDGMFDLFVEYTKSQIRRVKNKESSTRNSILYLNIMSETKAMILQSRNLMKAQRLFMGYGKSKRI